MDLTRRSISRLDPSTLNFGLVSCGKDFTEGGKSHSWERPTSWLSNPRAQTISVALAIRDTILFVILIFRYDHISVSLEASGFSLYATWEVISQFHLCRIIFSDADGICLQRNAGPPAISDDFFKARAVCDLLLINSHFAIQHTGQALQISDRESSITISIRTRTPIHVIGGLIRPEKDPLADNGLPSAKSMTPSMVVTGSVFGTMISIASSV